MNSKDPIDIQQVADIARRAGDEIMQVYQREFDVTHKGDGSPLTEADLAAHRLIVSGLRDIQPALPVLSEESRDIAYEERASWQRYWLVDPLDGTREFVNRNGEFTVNIALIENGTPRLGVVYAPVHDILYQGSAEHGAWRSEAGALPTAIRVRSFSGQHPCVVASRSHRGAALEQALERLSRSFGEIDIMSMGSSFKLCLVAEGRADLYPRLGPTSEWDTAAAHAVVNAAGGRVMTLDGRELQYNKHDLLNPWFIVCDGQYDWLAYFDDIPA
jgi:3'(2'), 5'-bisphosphate nucleotidase